MIAVLVALAGWLGAVARFHADAAVTRMHRASLPVGTLVINALGSLLLGLFCNLNAVSIHAYFRDRLGRTFLPAVAGAPAAP